MGSHADHVVEYLNDAEAVQRISDLHAVVDVFRVVDERVHQSHNFQFHAHPLLLHCFDPRDKRGLNAFSPQHIKRLQNERMPFVARVTDDAQNLNDTECDPLPLKVEG